AASALLTLAIVCLAQPAKAAPPASDFWPALARQLQADQKAPHKLFVPLWNHALDNEMALATPALFQPPADSHEPAGLYQPTGLFLPDPQAGGMWALDAATGKRLWKATDYQTPGGKRQTLKPIFCWPALTPDGARLITGQGLHEDANCDLVCFDTA